MSSYNYLPRRRWQRFPIELPVTLAVHGAAHLARVNASGLELNEGGMCLLAEREMTLGTQVAVEFTPPLSDESLRLRAWIRNRSGDRYGLEFLTENGREKKQVQRYRGALRLEAMQSHMVAALTLCSTAEHLLARHRVQEGRKAIEAARQTAQLISQHVAEPTHMPADWIAEIHRQLAELESRISSVASRCKPATKLSAILRQRDAARLNLLRSPDQVRGTRK